MRLSLNNTLTTFIAQGYNFGKYLFAFLTFICFQLNAQTLYFSEQGGALSTLDVTNCEVNHIVDTQYFTDIAIAPNGQFYGIIGNRLYTFDFTYRDSLIHTFDLGSFSSLAISNENIIYTANKNSDIYSYNLETQIADSLFNVGMPPEGDLTFHKGELWMSAAGDRYVKLDIQTGETSVELDLDISGASTGFTNPVNFCNGDAGYFNLSNRLDLTTRIYSLNFETLENEEICVLDQGRISGLATRYEYLNSLEDIPQLELKLISIDSADCNLANGRINLKIENTISLDYQLFLNGDSISTLGVSNLEEGKYFFEAYNEIGCYDSLTINLPCLANTSIEEIEQNEIIVYPNPAKNFLEIKKASNRKYGIYDINGKLIVGGKLERDSQTINLEQLQNGLYTLRIGTQTTKFIKVE